ncbi:MAG: hypothetical protein LBH25_00655 [Fibromonadaceae bacterium]|jgi:hypothetical protein|nr:hypothetical protein [Fibromonadaceae bacterium]
MPLELLSEEEMILAKIRSLDKKIKDYSEQRDYLVGKAVAVETAGMCYDVNKAYSLGIRWYSCKNIEKFKIGYREVAGDSW